MIRWCCALVLGGFLAGCGPQDSNGPQNPGAPGGAVEPAAAWPTLVLERRDAGKVAVVLRGVADRRPRMAEVRVRWSRGWVLESYDPGHAAVAAGKDVHVQPVSPTEARVVVFASGNTQRIGDGSLAEIVLKGSGTGTAEIVPTPPMLAPADAEVGLHLGDPISL